MFYVMERRNVGVGYNNDEYNSYNSHNDLFYYLKKFICFYDAEFCQDKKFYQKEEYIFQTVIFDTNEICIYYRHLISEKKCVTMEEFEKEHQ